MTDDEQAAYVDAAATLLGVPIGPYRDGVVGYFALAARMYATVEAWPLDVHDESAEAFLPR